MQEECSSTGGSEYTCELCGVRTTSYQTLQSHIRGRAHMDMIQRSEVAQRSVYVRGFSNGTSAEEDLHQLMGQFGGVVSLVVKTTDKDPYALVEFDSTEAALCVLKHTPPLTLNTHSLKVKPRLLKQTNKRLGQKPRVAVAMATTESSNSVVAGGDEDKIGGIHLTPETVAAVSSAHSVNAQLEAIALHCRLSNTVAEVQLSLAWTLQNKLRTLMPSCMVIPFGAPISGHGTVTSDCDLCVLSKPHPLDISLFSGPAYLSPHLLAHWERVQTSSPDLHNPDTQHREGLGSDFDTVLAVIQGDRCCSRILPIRTARCPIIRFRCNQLHCDLSLGNRLGPANTRLLAAYMNFDSRMAVLVPCVRMWARGRGLRRSQLNNYALSLLLIHSLQHATPPVLPCLQDPGMWPKNMVWIGSRGFTAEQSVQLGGWDCSFTDPLSLLPSTNTSSPAQLLLHFFQYFSEDIPFTEQVVAIHTLSPLLISQLTSGGQGVGFKVSSLCLQDPFDCSHNVTKNVKAVHLHLLIQTLQSSQPELRELLSHEETTPLTRQNVLPLFKHSQTSTTTTEKKRSGHHFLQFNIDTMSCLLHNTCYAALSGRLQELDLSNLLVHRKLSHILLEALAELLEREFGFRVHSESHGSATNVVLPLAPVCRPHCSANILKRQRPDEEEVMEVEEGQGDGGGEGRGEEGGEGQEKVKRQRLVNVESVENLLFRLTEGQGSDYTIECSAMEESWIGRRRRRRAIQQQPGLASFSPETVSPCLSFTLSTPYSCTVVSNYTVMLQATEPMFQSSLQQFFSVWKQWLLDHSLLS